MSIRTSLAQLWPSAAQAQRCDAGRRPAHLRSGPQDGVHVRDLHVRVDGGPVPPQLCSTAVPLNAQSWLPHHDSHASPGVAQSVVPEMCCMLARGEVWPYELRERRSLRPQQVCVLCCLDLVRASRSLRSFGQTCCGPQRRSYPGHIRPSILTPRCNPKPQCKSMPRSASRPCACCTR